MPAKGLVSFGLAFISIISFSFMSIVKSENMTVEKFVVKQIEKSADKIAEQKKIIEASSEENTAEILTLLDRPDLIAREMIASLPSYFFIGVFLMLWFNMFLVLKSRRLLFAGTEYPYSESQQAQTMGRNVVYVLGVS